MKRPKIRELTLAEGAITPLSFFFVLLVESSPASLQSESEERKSELGGFAGTGMQFNRHCRDVPKRLPHLVGSFETCKRLLSPSTKGVHKIVPKPVSKPTLNPQCLLNCIPGSSWMRLKDGLLVEVMFTTCGQDHDPLFPFSTSLLSL